MIKSLGVLLVLLMSVNGFAKTGDSPLCEEKNGKPKRLTVFNYVKKQKKIRKSLVQQFQNGQSKEIVTAIYDAGRVQGSSFGESEVCRWNRFLFVDFVIYFGQTGDYIGQSAHGHPEYMHAHKIRLLNLRDLLYREWLSSLSYNVRTGFSEFEEEDLAGEPLEQFLGRGTKQFRLFHFISKILNRKKKNKTFRENQEADLAVQNLLQPKTPFSSVLPSVVLADIQEEGIREATQCLKGKLQIFSCEQNVWDEAVDCANGDELRALEILGAISSQRMYLLRDFKGWLEQNTGEREFSEIFDALKDGSEIYFLLETRANQCGPSSVVPSTVADDVKTQKPYHLYSVAYLASRLAEIGYQDDLSDSAALKPARKYKKFIALPGVIYNALLGRPLRDGTVGDRKQITREQEIGAHFGYDLGNRYVEKREKAIRSESKENVSSHSSGGLP